MINSTAPAHKHTLPAPWRELRYYASLDSTQRELVRLHAAGEPVRGLALQAEQQTEGHGRRNNGWLSGPGGLYISVGLPAALTPSDAPPGWLPLTAALACAEALEEQLGLPAQIKWPNDVVHAGSKIAGLIGASTPTAEGPLVMLGMGLNWLNATDGIEREDAPPAASVRDFIPDLTLQQREQFGALWLERMTWLFALLRGAPPSGREGLRAMAEERLFLRGERVRLREAGQPDRTGIALGLAEDAALRLETADGKATLVYNGSLTADQG